MAKMWNRPDAELEASASYFRAACPDMVITQDYHRADYTVAAIWSDKWVVIVDREGLAFPFSYKADSRDALESFRRSCAAMRDEANERYDFESRVESLPVGRYLLQSPNPNHVFLLDTKTGAVWELKQNPFEERQQFYRMPVEGVYAGDPRIERPPKNP